MQTSAGSGQTSAGAGQTSADARQRLGGLGRMEIAATVVVVLLVVTGLLAFWLFLPGGAAPAPVPPGGEPVPAGGAASDAAASDAELAPLRARAQLPDCPRPAPGGRQATGAPQAQGPLAGVLVPCLGGPGQVDLGAALAGRVTVLNLWGSWCEPCRRELPALASYAGRPGAVPVLGVDVRDTPQAGLAMLADLGVRLPSVSDPDGRLRAALGAPPAVPLSYLVRADGSVARIDPPVPLTSPDEVAAAVTRYAGSGT